MIRAVVKWSYIKGRSGLARAKAHINYIQYREGKDRERGPRKFFDSQSDSITGAQVKTRLNELDQRGVQIHKIILSPGLNNADMFAYTREMMTELSRSKGLDLEWYAVNHENTEHFHTHVVVMGTDLHGRKVHLSGRDSKSLRKWGNEFLEREHCLDRYLDGELKRILQEPTRAATLQFHRQRGDQEFERLMFGDASGTYSDWKVFEQELQNSLATEPSYDRQKSYKQYQTESAGRLLDFHETYQTREMKKYWNDIEESFPELAADARRELAWIESISESKVMANQGCDLDKLMDGLDQIDRDIRAVAGPEAEYIRQTTRVEDIRHDEIDRGFSAFAVYFQEHIDATSRELSSRISDKQSELDSPCEETYEREQRTDDRDERCR